MGNQKLSQLNSLTWNQVAANDLFYIVDTSIPESKNIDASDLTNFVLNNGSITASLNGTASWANTAVFALSAPSANSVNFASSSLSSSWASSSFNAISSSFSTNSQLSQTASYALIAGTGTSSFALNAVNATSASLAQSSITAISASEALLSNVALFANTAGTASIALALAYTGNNMSGNFPTMTSGSIYMYDTASGASEAYIRNIASSSTYAQLDNVTVNSPYILSNPVNISARGLINIVNYNGGTESDFKPTLSLIVQDLFTGITQSLQSISYQSQIPAASNSNKVLRFFLNGIANLSGVYRIFVNSTWHDDCDGDMDFYFYNSTNPAVFRIIGNAYNLIIENGSSTPMTVEGGGFPVLTPFEPDSLFFYTSSWVLHGQTTSSIDTGPIGTGVLASAFIAANSSSYITSLLCNQPDLTSLTGLWTLTSLQTLILNNAPISFIDCVAPSVISMSLVNCSLTQLPPFTASIPYSLSYLNASNVGGGNNNIQDISVLPPSMSYINMSGNQNLNTFGVNLPYGIKYLNVSSCGLQLEDMDEVTSMLVSVITPSASNTTGILDLSGNTGLNNGGIVNQNSLSWYNISSSIASNIYNTITTFTSSGAGINNWTVKI